MFGLPTERGRRPRTLVLMNPAEDRRLLDVRLVEGVAAKAELGEVVGEL